MSASDPIRNIAILGASGAMGRGISLNAARNGFAVRALDRSSQALQELVATEGIQSFASAAEAVTGAEAIVTVLTDAETVLEVMQQALPCVSPGAVWVQSATIGPDGTERCAELARRHGIVLLDAPLLGSRLPALRGELTILASGPTDVRARIAPLFDAIGQRTLWVGEAGAGSRLKLAVNTWILGCVQSAVESLALTGALGLDPSMLLDAVAGTAVDAPLLQIKGKAIVAQDFEPTLRLSLAAKDARLAADASAEHGLDLPALAATAVRMAAAAELYGEQDMSATYRLCDLRSTV